MTKSSKDYLIDWLIAHDPDEWHRVALSWNWDMGYEVLNWVVDQRACDKGTVLQLFWLAAPDGFLAFRDRDDVLAKTRWNIENYDFLVRVLTHWSAGNYANAAIATEGVADSARAYAYTEDRCGRDNLPWIVPDDMRRDIDGKVIDHSGYSEGYPPALVAKFNAEGILF